MNDPVSKAAYIYYPNDPFALTLATSKPVVYTLDNDVSIKEKIKIICEYDLGGLIIWDATGDVRNDCSYGYDYNKYSLTKTIEDNLTNNILLKNCPKTKTVTFPTIPSGNVPSGTFKCTSSSGGGGGGCTGNCPNYCGTSWSDAQENCSTAARCLLDDSGCPQGQVCNAGITCSGSSPSPGQTNPANQTKSGSGPNFCGIDWSDANSNCSTAARCNNLDSECPSDQHCFSSITCSGDIDSRYRRRHQHNEEIIIVDSNGNIIEEKYKKKHYKKNNYMTALYTFIVVLIIVLLIMLLC